MNLTQIEAALDAGKVEARTVNGRWWTYGELTQWSTWGEGGDFRVLP